MLGGHSRYTDGHRKSGDDKPTRKEPGMATPVNDQGATDTCQRRDGEWVYIAGEVVAKGE
jgi:hypothetical protein